MSIFIIGMLLFFSVHFISVVNDPWRNKMATQLGELAWKGLYSVISIVGLLLLVKGYGDARPTADFIYVPPSWTSHLAALLMLPVFPLLIAAYIPGRIKGWVKHPMLVAVKFWALAHLISNGRTIELILFGTFLMWAVLVRISYKKRDIRPNYGLPESRVNDLIAVIGGVGLYVVFAKYLHGLLIGVYPFG